MLTLAEAEALTMLPNVRVGDQSYAFPLPGKEMMYVCPARHFIALQLLLSAKCYTKF